MLYCLLIMLLFSLLSVQVAAYSLGRSFSKTCPDTFTVSLTLDKNAGDGNGIYTIDELIPDDLQVISSGTGAFSDFGNQDDPDAHIMWSGAGDYRTHIVFSYTLRDRDGQGGNDIQFTGSTYQIGVDDIQFIGDLNMRTRTNTCDPGGQSQLEWGAYEWSDDADSDGRGRGCTCPRNDCDANQNFDNNPDIHPDMPEGDEGNGAEGLLCNAVDDDCSAGDCCRGYIENIGMSQAVNTVYSCKQWQYYDTFCNGLLELNPDGVRAAAVDEMGWMVEQFKEGTCATMTINNLFDGILRKI